MHGVPAHGVMAKAGPLMKQRPDTAWPPYVIDMNDPLRQHFRKIGPIRCYKGLMRPRVLQSALFCRRNGVPGNQADVILVTTKL
jgi:hypothetical protein